MLNPASCSFARAGMSCRFEPTKMRVGSMIKIAQHAIGENPNAKLKTVAMNTGVDSMK